jgi:hypothetical protein
MPDTFVTSPARRFAPFALALALLAFATTARAQVWTESGDAGDLVPTAQHTSGAGALTTITGSLASPTDVDLYCVHLVATPPAGLPIVSLQCVIIQGPNVWLFDAAGNGVFTNELCAGGGKTLLAPNVSLPPGTYYIGVSYSEVDPFSAGGPIWIPALLGQRSPDGPGAAGSLIGWGGPPNPGPINPYQISLNFFSYCDAATPTLLPTWGSLKSYYR